jgi:hypothetical protein
MEPLLTKVDSSNIRQIGFDGDSKVLYVEFQPKDRRMIGTIYSYWPFTRARFNALMKAESKGEWFAKRIRDNDKYLVKKVRG